MLTMHLQPRDEAIKAILEVLDISPRDPAYYNYYFELANKFAADFKNQDMPNFLNGLQKYKILSQLAFTRLGEQLTFDISSPEQPASLTETEKALLKEKKVLNSTKKLIEIYLQKIALFMSKNNKDSVSEYDFNSIFDTFDQCTIAKIMLNRCCLMENHITVWKFKESIRDELLAYFTGNFITDEVMNKDNTQVKEDKRDIHNQEVQKDLNTNYAIEAGNTSYNKVDNEQQDASTHLSAVTSIDDTAIREPNKPNDSQPIIETNDVEEKLEIDADEVPLAENSTQNWRDIFRFEEPASVSKESSDGIDDENLIAKALAGINAYKKLPRGFSGHLSFMSSLFDRDRGSIRAQTHEDLISDASSNFQKKVIIYALLASKDGKELKHQVAQHISREKNQDTIKQELKDSILKDLGNPSDDTKKKLNELVGNIVRKANTKKTCNDLKYSQEWNQLTDLDPTYKKQTR